MKLFGRHCRLSIVYGKPLRFPSVTGAEPSLDDFKAYANEVMGEVGKLRLSDIIYPLWIPTLHNPISR